MKALRNYLDKIKPNFEEGGKFHAFRSVFDGFETFLFVPNTTAKSGTHIHDSIDSKRIMSMVVIALMPALLFGMFRALSNVYTGFDFLTALNIPSTVYNMLPYIISLIVLAFTSKKSRAPKAEGIPYDKGSR